MYLLRHRPGISSTPGPGLIQKRWARHADATFQRRNQSPHLTLHIQLVRCSEARLIIRIAAKLMGYYIQLNRACFTCAVRKLKPGIIYMGCSSRYAPQFSLTPHCFFVMSDRDATDSDRTLDHDNSDSDLILPIPKHSTTTAEYQQVMSILVAAHKT
jgi:hypothetical protein